MDNDNEKDYDYEVRLKIEDVRLLHYCVMETIRTWPGAPRRPVEEQEHLIYLRDSLQRMKFDYNFREL
jgi:hypothetical protein|tara:strand:- start:1714 stop:1917 length:204 start_codon:yes stop_codon:yes gene_type:complete